LAADQAEKERGAEDELEAGTVEVWARGGDVGAGEGAA
jgi:hypothetical protein